MIEYEIGKRLMIVMINGRVGEELDDAETTRLNIRWVGTINKSRKIDEDSL